MLTAIRFRPLGLVLTAIGILMPVLSGCGIRNPAATALFDEIVFTTDSGQEGFRSYLEAPAFKAFAAAPGPDGRYNSWGKAWHIGSLGAAVEAALDRCRSYRGDTDGPCRLIAVNNEAVRTGATVEHTIGVARIDFGEGGLDGSPAAALSYAPRADRGHLWLVDQARNRDCKGEWQTRPPSESGDAPEFIWDLVCLDGLRANGIISDPSVGRGSGNGRDNRGGVIGFTFQPR